MKNRFNQELILLEDHHQAYYEWRKHGFSHQTLIHIDAHLDYELVAHKNIDIGNFLFFAVKEGIVAKIYWVIPGSRKNLNDDIIFLKQILAKIHKPSIHDRVSFSNGIIQTKINNISLYICTLSTLPVIREPVLLDIDIDFFVFDRIRKNNPLDNIGKRKPWITTERFIHIMQKKIRERKYTTISYSVNGGYTPIIYKTIGDEIASYLGYSSNNLKKRLLAGKNFSRFRKLFAQKKYREARKFYQLALILNKKYLVRDNNYGMLFLLTGDRHKAEKEFSRMLKINPADINCLTGLGIINIYKHNLVTSRNYFQRMLGIDPDNKTALLYLAYLEFASKNYSKSKKYIDDIGNRLGVNKIFGEYFRAKFFEINRQFNLTERIYQKILEKRINEDLHIPPGLELLL